MEGDKKPFYKYCIVPRCENTIRNAPDIQYFHVPRDVNVRKKWCKAMRRDEISSTSSVYCCEDHFNVEEDTDNYIQYKIMTLQEGQKITLRLKKGVVPHIFQCQSINKPELNNAWTRRKRVLKRKRKALIEVPSEATLEECGTTQKIDESLKSTHCTASSNVSSKNNIKEEFRDIDIKEEPIWDNGDNATPHNTILERNKETSNNFHFIKVEPYFGDSGSGDECTPKIKVEAENVIFPNAMEENYVDPNQIQDYENNSDILPREIEKNLPSNFDSERSEFGRYVVTELEKLTDYSSFLVAKNSITSIILAAKNGNYKNEIKSTITNNLPT